LIQSLVVAANPKVIREPNESFHELLLSTNLLANCTGTIITAATISA
jgi:hypothetical protein